MADLFDKLQSKPEALKAFLNLPEDTQTKILSAMGINEMSRSDQRSTLKGLLPGYGSKPMKEQIAYLDKFAAPTDVPPQMDTLAKQNTGKVVDPAEQVNDTKPVEQKLAENAVTAGSGVAAGNAVGQLAEGAGSFAQRAVAALKNTPKSAGEAVGKAEVAAAGVPAGARPPVAADAQGDISKALEGVKNHLPIPAEPEDPIAFTNALQQDLAKNGANLPIEKVAAYDKQINMLLEDKSLPNVVRGPLGEYAAAVKKILNAKAAGRSAASQVYGDVMTKQKVMDALQSGAKVLGTGAAAGLGIKKGMDLFK